MSRVAAAKSLSVLLACALAATARAVWAQDSEITATALFNEGRRLANQGRYNEACPKFAESQRLAPSGGTLMNLAECYERTGRTASAWASWNDAAARANAAGKAAAEKSALAHAAALEPALSKITVTVDARSDVAGLTVKRDGVTLGRGEFGVPLPVDPGTHVIEATAPQKQPWSTRVSVPAEHADVRVNVSLADLPEGPSVSPSTGGLVAGGAGDTAPPPAGPPVGAPAPSGAWSGQKTAALVAGGLGLLGAGLGTAFALEAKSKNDEALQPANCPTSRACYPSGLQLTDDAKNAATVSTIAFAAGGAALLGGVVLWVTAPGAARREGLNVAPTIGRSFAGLAVRGGW